MSKRDASLARQDPVDRTAGSTGTDLQAFERLPSAKTSSLPLIGLWMAAAALMLAVHGAGIWVARDWHPIEPPPAGDPLPPIEIDLAPPAIPPELPPQEAIPEIQPEAAQDVPTETAPTETAQAEPQPVQPEEVQPTPPPEPDPAPPEEVQPITPPEPEIIPETPERDKAEVVVPVVPKPDRKPDRKPEKKPPPRRKPEPRPQPQQPRQQLQPPQEAAPAKPRGQASGSDIKAWANGVRARVARITNGRGGTTKGNVSIVLRISGTGQMLSVSASGGDPTAVAKARSLVGGLGSVAAPPGGAPQTLPMTLIFK